MRGAHIIVVLAASACGAGASSEGPVASRDASPGDDTGDDAGDDAGGDAATATDARAQDARADACSGSGCACPTPLTRCGSVCVDTITSNDDCGGCGVACRGTKTCFRAACAVVPPPMPTPRSALSVTAGADGRVYAIGGWNGSSRPYGNVEIYSPTTNTWTTGAPMPTPRNGHATALGADGRLYVIGGGTFNNAPTVATLEIYDPTRDAWVTGPSMPTPRMKLAAARGADGRIYAIGGDDAGYRGPYTTYATVEAYDPVANAWSTAPSLPWPLTGLGAAVGKDARIYAIGSARAAAYDVGARQWSATAPMPDTMANAAVVRGPDDLLYVIAGEQGLNAWPFVQTYDVTSHAWTSGGMNVGLGVARYLHGAAVGGDGRIYAVGGYTGTGVLASVEALAPGGTWIP